MNKVWKHFNWRPNVLISILLLPRSCKKTLENAAIEMAKEDSTKLDRNIFERRSEMQGSIERAILIRRIFKKKCNGNK